MYAYDVIRTFFSFFPLPYGMVSLWLLIPIIFVYSVPLNGFTMVVSAWRRPQKENGFVHSVQQPLNVEVGGTNACVTCDARKAVFVCQSVMYTSVYITEWRVISHHSSVFHLVALFRQGGVNPRFTFISNTCITLYYVNLLVVSQSKCGRKKFHMQLSKINWH